MQLPGTNRLSRPLRVLLIDDDEEEYILLREMIAAAPDTASPSRLELGWVSDYEQARAALHECRHDVYLLDYRLGSHSGLDLLREMQPGHCAAPIIILTGSDNPDVDLAAMELGAAGYLVKRELNLSLLERSIRYALDRTQVQSSLQQLVSEREALQRATSSLLGTLDVSRLLSRILDAAQDAIPVTGRAALVLVDQPQNRSNRLVSMDHQDARVFTIEAGLLPTSVMDEFHEGGTFLIGDAASDPLILPFLKDQPGVEIGSALVAPLLMGREMAGVLLLTSPSPSAFEESMREPLTALAATATAALQNAIIYSETRELATTDPLTGIANHREIFEAGQREVERARRFSRPLSAIMFDIDWFKGINDKYGHVAGDEVLTGIVDRCRRTIRHVDILARYGGDEFAILLPEADQRLATDVAARIRAAVVGLPMHTNAGPVHVSISIGIAEAGEDTPDIASLLNKADRALYRSKQAGRNTITVLG